MVMSCSDSAVISDAIDSLVFLSDFSSWPRCRTAGSAVRAWLMRLSISARIRAGSAMRPTTWSQTTRSR
jgi:hypothetical protein